MDMAETTKPERVSGKPIPGGLARAHAERARRKAEGLPEPERTDPLEKARRHPESLRLAINAKCFDCVGQDADPCWQWRVGNCASRLCPLRPVRPYQDMEGRPIPTSLAS